jgi:uncharacterized membrane protein YfcA
VSTIHSRATWFRAALLTTGLAIGTIAGERNLLGIPPKRFRAIVGGVIGLLGVWIVAQSLRGPQY